MAVDLGTAYITISAETSQLSRGIDGAKLLMAGLGAAAVGAAGDALKLAGAFQQSNTQLVTSAGESLNNLKMVSDGILQTSIDTGTSTQNLEAAMYTIESSGAHGKQALIDLAAAARGAKAENASLSDVANAETTIMVDYASKHITAANAINDLIATVSRGKTHLQDLAASFSNVLPTANAVGVSLYDVSGAMATMTGEGVDAASSATYLRQLLLNLEAPGKKAADTLKSIGLSTADVAAQMKISLPDTLALIEDHLKSKFPEGSAAYVAALKDIAGGTKTIQGILDLTGTHLQTFKTNVDQITQSVKDSGTQISGWQLVQHNFNFELDQARAALDAMLIKIGQGLMPIVTQFLTQDVMPAVQHFQEWENQTHGVEDAFQLLVNATQDVINGVETLVSWIGDFIQGVQQGNPAVAALAGALTSVGTAIALIKIEEVAAGWYNWFQKMQQGAGFIANVGDKALPELSQALGWTKIAAQEAETEIEQIAPKTLSASQQAQADIDALIASFEEAGTAADGTATQIATIGPAADTAKAEVATSAGGMTLAMGTATLGISLAFGVLAATIIATQNDITLNTHQMSAATQKEYNAMGQSGVDNAAKAKAAQIENSVDTTNEIRNQGGRASEAWVQSYDKQKQASADARAQMVLDQAKIADAAVAAATKADDAWTKASQDMQIIALLQQAGWTGPEIQKYLAGSGTNTSPVGINTGPTIGGHHASGGAIPSGQYGFVSEPGTGGELVYSNPGGGTTVYTGSQSRAMMGGGGFSGTIEVHPHIYLDSREMTSMLMNRAVKQIRVATGVKL